MSDGTDNRVYVIFVHTRMSINRHTIALIITLKTGFINPIAQTGKL